MRTLRTVVWSTGGLGANAMASTAMRVVIAIPYVVDAAPGLLSSLDIPTTLPRYVFD